MGLEQAIAASMALQIGSSVYSGVEANNSAKVQADLFEQQADIALAESKKEAARVRQNYKAANARKKLAYLNSGVGIQGSAANVIASDMNLQNEEIDAVLASGVAQYGYYNQRGVTARNEGRAQLIGNIVGGASNAFSTYATGKALGAFDKKVIPKVQTPVKPVVSGKMYDFNMPTTTYHRPPSNTRIEI